MGLSSDGYARQQRDAASIRRTYERCLSDCQRVDVTFVSRRTGLPVTRHCLPVPSDDDDSSMLHFLAVDEGLQTVHPLALLLERVLCIEPSGHPLPPAD